MEFVISVLDLKVLKKKKKKRVDGRGGWKKEQKYYADLLYDCIHIQSCFCV